MSARTHEERAISLFENIKPELLKLLNNSPAFGSVGIDLIIHDGEITRIISRIEVSRQSRMNAGGMSYNGEAVCHA
jgi:hypothetical protein